MAKADYRLCDVCDNKAFYDTNLNYDFDEYPETGLFNLGDWRVLCRDCKELGYRVEIKKPQPAEEGE